MKTAKKIPKNKISGNILDGLHELLAPGLSVIKIDSYTSFNLEISVTQTYENSGRKANGKWNSKNKQTEDSKHPPIN